MIIIDAYWEKRNLGVSTAEIIVDEKDDINIFEKIKDLDAEYIVLKIPVARVDLYYKAREYNFVFIECMNDISHNLVLPPLDKNRKDIVINTEFLPMGKDDIDIMFNNIKKGMFKTDRIALDSYFSIEIAARRYINWITDELNRNSEIYKFVYDNDTVGFIGFKNIDNEEYHDFISGIYSDFLGKGYAINMTYKLVDEIIKRNGKKLTTTISSNNVKSLQSRLRHGFVIDSSRYIFVKHK